jgi:methylmalonyl-CoA mutase, C-terminal domain
LFKNGLRSQIKLLKAKNVIQDAMSQSVHTKRIRILVSKLGLDGHDRGALVLCRAFRDAGMEVIYSGLFATPERIAQIVEDEDIDVVALSLLNGAHLTLFPRVAKAIKDKGIDDVLVIGGGVIPEDDKPSLEKGGVLGNFGPGTPLSEIIDFIQINLSKIKKD